MKAAFTLLALLSLSSLALADIQQPPASEYGPTRKLGRGIANVAFGITEIPDSIFAVNYSDGNAAAFSYGIVRGVGRAFARLGYGIYDIATFPAPTYKGSYRPPYQSSVPWINSGYQEFPPELGWESRYDYTRDYSRSPW